MTVFVERGRWFEEFHVGDRVLHRPARTVTQADNALFCGLTLNPQALHRDAAAATHPFGRPVINSMWTLSTLVGISVAALTQDTLVAQLGLTEVTFPAPLFPDDTLSVETDVLAARLSASRPGEGIVTLRHTGRNQHGVVVAAATRVVLVRCAPEQPTASAAPERAGGA